MRARANRRLLLIGLWIAMMIGAMGSGFAAGSLGSSLFKDVKASSPYDAAIGEMVQLGIMPGVTSSQFRPNSVVKRGELALILKRFRDSLNNVTVSTASTNSAGSVTTTATSSRSSARSSVIYVPNPAGYLRFTTGLYSVNESLGTLPISIVRTGGNQGTVTVDYVLTPDTAVAGTDYVDAKGTPTFANKETSKKIDVQVKDDGQSKAERFLKITLKNPQYGAGISYPDEATIKILDRFLTSGSSASAGGAAANASSVANVANISLAASAYGASENDGSLTVTVVRSGITSTAVSVNYATQNGTAGGGEHTPVNGKLDFAAGETTKTFSVSVPDDSSVDGSKTANIVLSSPSNGSVLVFPSNAVFTIYDNESGTFGSGSIKLSKSTYDATEGSGKATVTIMRVGGTKGTATVGYTANGGSATEGTDYTGVSATMTFSQGEASKIVNVPVYKDTSADSGETINFVLGLPTGALQGDPSMAVITLSE